MSKAAVKNIIGFWLVRVESDCLNSHNERIAIIGGRSSLPCFPPLAALLGFIGVMDYVIGGCKLK